MSSSPSSSPKKVLFKDFANDHRSRLTEKYPFLTNQQIQAKLKQLWKKVCQENKEMAKNNQSPRTKSKSSYPDKKSPGSRKRLTWKTDSKGSPLKTVSEASTPMESPVSSEVDSGPWYDDVAMESRTDSSKKSQENLTEEAVTDVFNHELKMEEQENSSEKESDTVKMEPVLSELFPSRNLSLGKEELSTPKSSRYKMSSDSNAHVRHSFFQRLRQKHTTNNVQALKTFKKSFLLFRLLSSQEEEGDSNFNLMFYEEEKIFF